MHTMQSPTALIQSASRSSAYSEMRSLGVPAVSSANFGKLLRLATVGTMNIPLPEELRDFVEEQVKRGYGTSSEYVRELIRRDQDRLRLRNLLVAGAASPLAAPADGTYRHPTIVCLSRSVAPRRGGRSPCGTPYDRSRRSLSIASSAS